MVKGSELETCSTKLSLENSVNSVKNRVSSPAAHTGIVPSQHTLQDFCYFSPKTYGQVTSLELSGTFPGMRIVQ